MKKVLKLLEKLLFEFIGLGRNYSWKYATYNLIWWLCFYVRTRYSWELSHWALKKKTAWLDQYLAQDFEIPCETDYTALSDNEYKIWVFWGQGEDAMPPLVKACYRQLTKYNENVSLITNNNLKEYIDIPEIVYQKVYYGQLTWAHFSDIVRTTLLAKYGGLWLDATVWVAGKLPLDKIRTMTFWSANYKTNHVNRDICFWTSGDWSWSTWCMSANNKNSFLFSFLSKAMISTATIKDSWPDYVFQDYLINYACRHFQHVRVEVENMKLNNPKRNSLASIMNEIYNPDKYKALLSTDFVFKLSYKANWKTEVNGKSTFFGQLIKGDL